MKESARISELFQDLYNGDPWLDVNFTDTLKNIDAKQASKRISAGRNTIWEILEHVIQWRLNVLRRVQGEMVISPDNNYLVPVEDDSEAAWQKAQKELQISQERWINFLKEFDEAHFENEYPGNKTSYYKHIHGIIQHDAYHLGQIVLLSRIV